jgi:hypothetical protein
MSEQDSEAFRIYIMRHADRNEWLAKARAGDQAAKLCQWAASKWMKAMPMEHSACSCCDMVFSPGDIPRAFIVLVPVKEDPKKVKAKAGGVCSDCSSHEDKWLVDQGVRRQGGLSPTEGRPGDQVH